MTSGTGPFAGKGAPRGGKRFRPRHPSRGSQEAAILRVAPAGRAEVSMGGRTRRTSRITGLGRVAQTGSMAKRCRTSCVSFPLLFPFLSSGWLTGRRIVVPTPRPARLSRPVAAAAGERAVAAPAPPAVAATALGCLSWRRAAACAGWRGSRAGVACARFGTRLALARCHVRRSGIADHGKEQDETPQKVAGSPAGHRPGRSPCRGSGGPLSDPPPFSQRPAPSSCSKPFSEESDA